MNWDKRALMVYAAAAEHAQANLDRQFAAMRGTGRPSEYRTKDGERVPSTTTITGRFKDSAGLINWANAEGLAGRKLYQDSSAIDVGHLVHSMVEATIHGQEKPEIPDEYAERVQSAYGAWDRWWRANQFEVVATEVPLVSEEWKYGGTIDTVLRDSDGNLCLGDWKTSNAVYADYLIQLAAYAHLWNENASDESLHLTGGFHLVRFSKEHGDMEHRHFPELDDAWTMFMLFRQSYELDKLLKKRAR